LTHHQPPPFSPFQPAIIAPAPTAAVEEELPIEALVAIIASSVLVVSFAVVGAIVCLRRRGHAKVGAKGAKAKGKDKGKNAKGKGKDDKKGKGKGKDMDEDLEMGDRKPFSSDDEDDYKSKDKKKRGFADKGKRNSNDKEEDEYALTDKRKNKDKDKDADRGKNRRGSDDNNNSKPSNKGRAATPTGKGKGQQEEAALAPVRKPKGELREWLKDYEKRGGSDAPHADQKRKIEVFRRLGFDIQWPLHFAAMTGDARAVKALTKGKRGEAKCNVHQRLKDYRGLTALGCAAAFGRLECCVELVLGGADVFVIDDDGKTPLQGALACDQMSCVDFLTDCESRCEGVQGKKSTKGKQEQGQASETPKKKRQEEEAVEFDQEDSDDSLANRKKKKKADREYDRDRDRDRDRNKPPPKNLAPLRPLRGAGGSSGGMTGGRSGFAESFRKSYQARDSSHSGTVRNISHAKQRVQVLYQ
jgi:hypothetical protein